MSERVRALVGLASGLVFSLGLGISGMAQPEKVLAFLDLGGDWNPSLLLVMGAAVPVHAVALWALSRRGAPLLGGVLPAPSRAPVDARLVLGAGLFGVGWGLCGICPGPALVTLATGAQAVIFLAALLVGVLLARGIATRGAARQGP